jgi:hypothetical protein
MNTQNTTATKMPKKDYFRLPPEMRMQADGPMVLSVVNGLPTFVRVEIIEFN